MGGGVTADGIRRDPGWFLLAAASLGLALAVSLGAASLVHVERWLPPALGLSVRAEGPGLMDAGIAWRPAARSAAGLRGESLEALVGVLVALAACVALVCAVNLGALMANHFSARRRELALRRAVGASRRALRRQLAAEALATLAAGAAVGAAGGLGAVEAIQAGLPAAVSASGSLAPDAGAALLLFGLPAATLLAGYLWAGAGLGTSTVSFGGGPSLSERLGPDSAVTGGERALAALQVAGLTVLVVASGLLLRGPAFSEDLGDSPLDAPDTLAIDVALSGAARTGARGERAAAYRALRARVGASLGAESVALASPGAVLGLGARDRVLCRGCARGAMAAPVVRVRVRLHAVSPGFFDTLDADLIEGRPLPRSEGGNGGPAALVNRAFAARYGAPAGGARLQLPGRAYREEWYRVVGIVENLQPPGLGVPGRTVPAVYLSTLRHPPASATVLVAGAGPGEGAAARAGSAAAAAAGVEVGSASALGRRLEEHLEPLRVAGRAAGGLGALALLAALAGLTAVTLLALRRRWRELGIRRAVGASRGQVLRLLLGDAGRLLRTGAAVGLVFAWGLGRGLAHWFPGVRPGDPLLYLGLAALLSGTVVLATWAPARRALGRPPGELLRAP